MVDDLVEIRVTFEFPASDDGQVSAYRDALYFSQDDYAALTPEQLAAAKQERYDNWLTVVTAAPDPETPAVQSQDDVASQAAEIATAAAALAQQAADLAAANQPAVADGGT